ncbi:MAG: hypothetical protein AB7F28_04515 [Candidatus Margulisiibacteriota bacterium]
MKVSKKGLLIGVLCIFFWGTALIAQNFEGQKKQLVYSIQSLEAQMTTANEAEVLPRILELKHQLHHVNEHLNASQQVHIEESPLEMAADNPTPPTVSAALAPEPLSPLFAQKKNAIYGYDLDNRWETLGLVPRPNLPNAEDYWTAEPEPLNPIAYIQKIVSANMTFSGYKTVEFQGKKSSGQAPDGFSNGLTRSETLKFLAIGQALGTSVNVEINQSSVASKEENKTRIELENQFAHVIFGEFLADFSRLDLMPYQEQIDGIQAKLKLGDHNAKLILSNPRGQGKKEVQYGNNSQGPYEVKFKPVVPNSQKIYLNRVLQQKDVDYEIDFTTGRIKFLKRILIPEDEITLTYDSENALYKDQVIGLGYGYSFSPSINSSITYLQKRASQPDTQAYAQNDVLIVHHKHSWERWTAEGEVGLTHYLPDTTSTNVVEDGQAGSIKLGYTGDTVRLFVFGKSYGTTFRPISAGQFSPGDTHLGIESDATAGPVQLSLKSFAQSQTLGGTPQRETESLAGVSFPLWQGQLKSAVRVFDHIELPSTGNSTFYTRSTETLALTHPIGPGQWLANTSLEQRQGISPQDSYTFAQIESGYSLPLGDQNTVSMEGRFKNQETLAHVSAKEAGAKLSSRWKSTALDLDGFIESRRQSNVLPITVINANTQYRPIGGLTVDGSLNLESLNESYNNQATDTEKWDYQVRTSLDPLKTLRLKYNLKAKQEKIKSSGQFAYNNTEQQWDLTSGFGAWATTAFSARLQNQDRLQLAYFPLATFSEATQKTTTYIAKAQTSLTPQTRIQVQYETEQKWDWALASTQNATYTLTHSQADHLKSELTHQWGFMLFGLGAESEKTIVTEPSANSLLKNTLTVSDRIELGGGSAVRLAYSESLNTENSLDFRSQKPEIEVDLRLFGALLLNSKYSLLTENRPEAITLTQTWNNSVSLDLNRRVLVSLTLNHESKNNPGYALWDGTGRVQVNF